MSNKSKIGEQRVGILECLEGVKGRVKRCN